MTADKIEIGLPVIYWSVINQETGKKELPLKTMIRSEVWKLGSGTEVCKVVGVTGGVSIDHLDPVTPGSLLAAMVQGCKEIAVEDIEQSTKDYFASKGVPFVNVNINIE